MLGRHELEASPTLDDLWSICTLVNTTIQHFAYSMLPATDRYRETALLKDVRLTFSTQQQGP